MSVTPHILMCPPDYYGIEYEINPWMDRRQQSDHALALVQWQRLRGLLEAHGADISCLTPQPGLPDLVFTANMALVCRDVAVPARFRHGQRQGEESIGQLEPHLKEEVIQKTLLKELKTPPDLFILSATELAGGWSGDVKYPVLAVQKSQESPLSKVGDTFRAGPRELLIQLAEGAAPLRVMFAAAVEPAAQEQAVGKLLEAGYHMDLAEPLERVTAALQSLVVKDS